MIFKMASLAANPPRGFHVQYIDDIAVLVLNNTENRFNVNSVQQLLDALDEVERNDSANALVITGIGKFFSNGLDLDWLTQQPPDVGLKFFGMLKEMNLKLATFPVPTIAALNGHAYAAGGILALLCDCRVMRTNKGWICLPEVQLKLKFSTMMVDLIRLKAPSPQVSRDMMIYGKRYTSDEALKVGLVEAVCEESQLLDCACKLAKQCIGKNGLDRVMLKTMKMDLYGTILEKSALKDEEVIRDERVGKMDAYNKAATSKL
ncbi:LOW QUALITY PROTEIN: uncharacterized protein [Amphiura filiformis]|uniref:LOW QUALITY PROTEIN: uncharacterized protein n=1 Tax=Amphiura filiformis TaxID=82378 RepID=UPI003B217DB4